jgi:hypothetical protein
MAPRVVMWSDPSDWMQVVRWRLTGYEYRYFEEPDGRFLKELMQ